MKTVIRIVTKAQNYLYNLEMKKIMKSMHFAKRPPRVLLMIPTANLLQRQILDGILRYAQQHGPWEFHMITGLSDEQGIQKTKRWGCSGVIALTRTKGEANSVLAYGMPAVFINPPHILLESDNPIFRHRIVIRDQPAIGRVGADYFLNRQYTHFAFIGDAQNKLWSLEREQGFVGRIKEQGFTCEVYPAPPKRERKDFGLEETRLRTWLRNLPKPIALMAARDPRARQVLDICMEEGISVPHEIAVLGVNNDQIFCETTIPPLSSISLEGENTGYDCAKLLDEQMRSKGKLRPCILYLKTASVVQRRSTDTTCISDPLIAKAIGFIHENIVMPINVAELAQRLNISQRLLEIKARKVIGRTICDEIQRIRLDRARTMLGNTKKTVSEIASACGFYDLSHFGRTFRKAFHITPKSFRASFRRN